MFFGTPDFAVPTLDRLLEGPHEVVGVVSQPDRPRGRGRKQSPSPVAERALRVGAPLLRPENVGDPASLAALGELRAGLGVVVAFGQFLTRRVRELPERGYLINAHASLLPRHRGAAPIAHAILSGDAETGVSIMRVEREMDAGPVCHVARTPIAPDEDAGALGERLAALAAEAVAAALDTIARGEEHFEEQDATLATLAPKLAREDARLCFDADASALARRVRAFAPRPGATTSLAGEPLRILRARVEGAPANELPGTVRRAPDGTLRIATGSGWLVPLVLQRAGGKALPVEAFLRGRPLPDGERLGEPS